MIIVPLIGIGVAIAGFIISAIISSLFGDNIVVNLINWFSWFIGLMSVSLSFILVPAGIIYLYKREIIESTHCDERSGNRKVSIMPDEIKGWNWGAAGLSLIWGVYHGVWIALLSFVPIINIFIWIILGLKGNEWAWRANKWENVEQFTVSQKKWKSWGVVFFVLKIVMLTVALLK